ncbi:helix-turn-helix transcriptional regulator [Pseudoduganella danionis]|uniref:Helix-turn-helix domain-containing protein n=1 Tax=Pseudoduganella danionis TaxID=1890295 RepID=A0ABW9SND0_9BURK|nr:helix-turn-helix transcriptional regulator [Pseudoduganella danionis]MTW33520.1 helix-turn-helix domain-containing protein [Pseudoduganella danionis]
MSNDYSERHDGPAMIVLRGGAEAAGQFQLGTREVDWHSHVRGQVFCVEHGLLHVETAAGSWLLPPWRAGWIPPGTAHKVRVTGALRGWSVLLAPDWCAQLPQQPAIVTVTPVLRALAAQAAGWNPEAGLTAAQQRLTAVLLDELQQPAQTALHLPMPQDRRLQRIAHALMAEPLDTRSMTAMAIWAGISPRNLNRLFRHETGCSYGQWREQLRLAVALEQLARGAAVAAVADALGYACPSNFIVMFKRHFGRAPGRYFRTLAPEMAAGVDD